MNFQALILFQTSDSDNITIDDEIKLPELIVFEIHGNNDPTRRIYVTHKMFESINNVKYINIQSVSLNKLTLESNEPAPIVDSTVYTKENSMAFNELIPILPMSLHKKNENLVKHRLIFLQPKDVEIVSYEAYKKTKRKTKSNNLFSKNKGLLFLRITHCGLRDISWDLFNGLDSLETLILENNAIDFIPDFSFYGASMLKSLSLANNKISHLQTTSLGGLLDLNYLNLKNNTLSILSESTFPPLPKLKVADLSNNPIEMVYPHTFEVMNATIQLTLGTNNTQLYLHQNSFVGLDSLEKLHLKSINVTVLERTLLVGLMKLVELKIEGSINHIAFDAFVEVSNIKKLILSNCSIKSVSMDAFYGIYNLEHLDLSYNQLIELPPGLFDQQFSLKELILNNNQLINIPDGLFKTMPNIKLIRLDMNPLHCTCEMKAWDVSLMTNDIKETNKHSCEWDHLVKGYKCAMKSLTIYFYNKKVEPICSSPTKFKGKTVSYVLRKYLNCNRKLNNLNNNNYMKKKYKEFKQYKLLTEQEVVQNTLINIPLISNSKLNTSLDDIHTSNISNSTKEIINNTNEESNIRLKTTNETFKSILDKTMDLSTERNVLLNNGTYISKSLLKEEIFKMKKKNKIKNMLTEKKLN